MSQILKRTTRQALRSLFLVLTLLLLSTAPILAADRKPPSSDITELADIIFGRVDISLNAKPGESVSQAVNVPVTYVLTDGTKRAGYEVVTFSLNNSVDSVTGAQYRGGMLAKPAATLTYVTCSGDLNGSAGNYTGKVWWHYDGTMAWHDSNNYVTWTANWPWQTTGSYYGHPTYPTGPLSSWLVSTAVFFNYLWITRTHQIDFTINGNGSCSAVGFIYD